jgi:phosphate transport system protein
MAQIVQEMVRDVMDAFVAGDVGAARAVIARDDEVDALYHDGARRLIAAMAADASLVETGIHLSAVLKFLERIGDHATNLGEQVIFMARGDEVRHQGRRDGAGRRD